MSRYGSRRCLLSALLALLLGAGSILARDVQITVLNTTDVHGHLLSGGEGDAEGAGGLLRCATKIGEIRASELNVILIDCGDLIQGSAESWLTRGGVMLTALEALHYDAWVLGNHDFDWGFGTIKALHDRATLPILGANIGAREGTTNQLYKVKPFVLREVDGVRVAIVGLTTPGIPTWLRPDVLGNTTFERSVEALHRIMPDVRAAKPDVMILAVHQGYEELGDNNANEINRITQDFPEFDIVLGGHLHKIPPALRLHGVLYLQAGCSGDALGRVDLVYDTVQKRVTKKDGVVLRIGEDTPVDSQLQAALQPDLDRAARVLDEEVGSTTTEISSSTKLPAESPAQQLIARAIAEKSGADVVLHGVLSSASIAVGPIRQRDLWRLVPYENRIGIAELTASELKEILEENTEQIGSTHFLGVYGLAYDLYPKAPLGSRVRNLRLPDGTFIHPKKRLRVASNSYALASGGGRFPALRRFADAPVARLEMTDIDTRNAVTDYVRKHSPLALGEGTDVRVLRHEDETPAERR